MALFQYGYRRFTEDVDVLLTREGLARVQGGLAGLDYTPTHAGLQNMRDASTGVRIDVLLAGEFPGDGKPKPVAFPDPGALPRDAGALDPDGVRYLPLPCLVDLEARLGNDKPGRASGICRTMLELIRQLKLPCPSFADRVEPTYVREKFRRAAQGGQRADPLTP